jgi:hypothetical protein
MDARGPTATHVLRKTIVARMAELSVAGFRDLVTGGAGGLLLLLPPAAGLAHEAREAVMALEEELLTAELDIPIYFAEETEELLELHATLSAEGEGSEAAGSAMAALLQSVSNSGYQLVVAAATPAPVKDQGVVSMAGSLSGAAGEDSPPSIVIVAHYDAGGAAPSLATGADSNGSGVSMLLELARLLSSLYASSRSHPAHSITFLLSGGGKINFAGTKRWLEEHLDMDTTSDLLANVDFVLCLDSVGRAAPLKLHVSKPPKEGSAGEVFLRHLNSVSQQLHGKGPIEVVHKKINLADDRYDTVSGPPLTSPQPGLGARALLHPPPAGLHPVRAGARPLPRALLHAGHRAGAQGARRQHAPGGRGPRLQPLPSARRRRLQGEQ